MPGQQQQLIKIRDQRQAGWFWIDNEIIDGYAKVIGIHALAVYIALVRHSKNEKCYPSYKHLAAELGVSGATIKRAIKKLREYNIIMVEMRLKTSQGRGSNVYTLLSPSEWKPVPNWSNQGKEYRAFKAVPVASKGVEV